MYPEEGLGLSHATNFPQAYQRKEDKRRVEIVDLCPLLRDLVDVREEASRCTAGCYDRMCKVPMVAT